MNKKNDKLFIVICIFLLFALMSWFIHAGTYSNGEYVSSGLLRIGLFDGLVLLYYALTYSALDLIYLFIIGGFYGVLTKCASYRKLVSKTVKFIKGKEILSMLFITFVMGVYTSLTNNVFSLLWVVPFIITVFLKRGEDRLTALSASFGGIFIGIVGQTLGTYGMNSLLTTFNLTPMSGIAFKIMLFVFAYVLFNVFAILHMRNTEKVNDLQYDLFVTEKVDEKDIPRSKRIKVWPTITFLLLTLLISGLAYLSWSDSFNITFFDQVFESISNVKVADVPIITSVLGSFTAFGKWTDLIQLGFVLFVTSIIIAFLNKMSLNDFVASFGEGMKKISKVAFIYLLLYTIQTVAVYFNWNTTVLNTYLGSGTFNIFTLFLFGFFVAFLFLDFDLFATNMGSFFTIHFTNNLIATSLILHTGFALGTLFLPTSFLLMMALTYLDVSYKSWLKYIWKFVLTFAIVAILLFAIMCYM